MNRKVKYARLHESIYVPGVGEMGPQLPTPNKIVQGFAMIATELGLEIFGNNEEAFVPWPNVKVVSFEAEVKIKQVKDVA